jgi:DUF4097 and DUF4098 domain-containing protein YvlB
MGNIMIKIRFGSTLVAGLVAASLVGAQDNEERISQSFDVGEHGEFSLSNISGDIRVEGTSGSRIVLEAVKRLHGRADSGLLNQVQVDVSHIGNRVRIETRYPRDRDGERNRRDGRRHDHGHGGVSVDYRVQVPKGTKVEVGSVSGDVQVDGVHGETGVNSVSGDVRVSDAANLVRAKSVSGDVVVERARSENNLDIASVSGEVTVIDVRAEGLDVGSVSGDVRMDDMWCEEGKFDSVSGDLRYSGSIATAGRYEFKSHSGDVVITIGDDVGFELEARTFSGDIESEFEMRVSSEVRRRRNMSAVVGDGSAIIEATTFSGDVSLRRR